MFFSSIFF